MFKTVSLLHPLATVLCLGRLRSPPSSAALTAALDLDFARKPLLRLRTEPVLAWPSAEPGRDSGSSFSDNKHLIQQNTMHADH